MSKKDEALKLALDALERLKRAFFKSAPDGIEEWESEWVLPAMSAITAIREALVEQPAQGCEFCSHHLYAGTKCKNCGREQPAQQRPQNCGTGYCSCIECLFEPEHQEPVAYAVYHHMGGSKSLHWPEQHSEDGDHNEYQLVPLYTSPPASKPWVGLTSEDKVEILRANGEAAVLILTEAKLREKNA